MANLPVLILYKKVSSLNCDYNLLITFFFNLMIKVRSLSTIGGENIKTNVRRLLAYMFSTDLARAINWIGKGGKTAFSTLKIKDVLTGMLVHVPLILIKNNLIHKYLYT